MKKPVASDSAPRLSSAQRMRASGDRVASGDSGPYPVAARIGLRSEGGDAQEAMASTPATRRRLGVAPHPPSISTPF
jgi:hypothetical protein